MKDEKTKKRINEAEQLLEKMKETLRPFLPKLDLSRPTPAQDWHFGDKCSQESTESSYSVPPPRPF